MSTAGSASTMQPFGPRISKLMSQHLSVRHHPLSVDHFIAAFKARFPTRQDAEAGFSVDMLGTDVDLSGPFSATAELRGQFLDDFSRLSDAQKQIMKQAHLDNYYAASPRPMAFDSGTTNVPGGEVQVRIGYDEANVEHVVLKVLCYQR
jgi:hypothetical protein